MPPIINLDVLSDNAQPEPKDSDDQRIEGGIEAWLTVAGSSLIYFASFGFINSFGFFQNYYLSSFLSSYPPSTVAFIGTLQITLLYLLGPVAGALFDAFGFKYLYPIAALGTSGSLLALSFTKSEHIWQQFLTQGLLFGFTVAFGVQPALAVVGQHFKRKRALVMGIAAGGSSLGGVCLPIMFSRLVPSIGFAWSLRVGALIILCCYLIAINISRTAQSTIPLKSVVDLLDIHGFKDKRYLILAIGVFLGSLGLYVPHYYIGQSFQSFYRERRIKLKIALAPFVVSISPQTSIKDYLLPLINASSCFGRILGGHAADRVGRLNLLYPMTILSGLLCYAMWLPAQSVNLVIAFVCIYGFCTGIFISVTPAVIAQITPEDKLGARLGAFFSTTAIATLIGNPIGGALLRGEERSSYRYLIVFAGSTLTTGGMVLFLGRILCERNLRKKW